MGAGKTTLIKALLKEMQSEDDVSSPTFSIVNEYVIPNDKVYHFDFYRINDIEEALSFGVEDYFYSNHWLFIEWSERIKALIPESYNAVNIEVIDQDQRRLNLTLNTNLLIKKPISSNQ